MPDAIAGAEGAEMPDAMAGAEGAEVPDAMAGAEGAEMPDAMAGRRLARADGRGAPGGEAPWSGGPGVIPRVIEGPGLSPG
jgi:hypothetical protein